MKHAAFVDLVYAATADGKFSEIEAAEIRRYMALNRMTDQERRDALIRVIGRYMDEFTQDGYVGEDEIRRLENLSQLLGIRYDQLVTTPAVHLQHLLSIQRLYAGHLPALDASRLPIVIAPGEVPHLFTQCRVCEERVVARTYTGGHGGGSLRIARGVRIGLGASRGKSLPIKEMVVVSSGHLLISSQRVAYLADKKAFNAPWKKVIAVEPYENGVRFHIGGRSTAPTLEYLDPRAAPFVEGIASVIQSQLTA